MFPLFGATTESRFAYKFTIRHNNIGDAWPRKAACGQKQHRLISCRMCRWPGFSFPPQFGLLKKSERQDKQNTTA